MGTFGVMPRDVLKLFSLFYWRVNVPLKKVIGEKQGIAQGHFDEIAQVARAFNSMVESLKGK